jgi:hypothetical protein
MESTKSFDIPLSSIVINPDDVLRALGYSKSSAPAPVIDKIKLLLSIFNEYVIPAGGFVLFSNLKVIIRDDSFSVGNIEFKSGNTIASQLADSEYIAAIIATAGSKVREMSIRLIDNGELLDGYIVDTIGSLAAESAADFVQNYVEDQAARDGLKVTNRLSPGYCGWDVSEQHKLFSLLPDNFCRVTLNESALMIPIKSISAVVGIGKNARKGPYPCSICDIEKCYMRK